MSDQRFQITQEYAVNVMQFVLPVTMDTMEIDGLIEAVLKSLEAKGGEPWVVDLAQVEYMGSSMLGLFVNVRERIRQGGGTLVLCGMSPQLLRIFKTCCLERLFTIAKSRADALALVSGR
ncbi:MAG: STAS domain-containing protein [Tepidisphaeraceae bacterium]|jgi:anti-anti-sigma factor